MCVCVCVCVCVQLFEDLQEREKNIASLESYATQLSQRIVSQTSLPLLPLPDPLQDTGEPTGDTVH